MISLFVLIAAVAISLLITRVATLALTLTGLSRELARFQARSAFTGVGFTTSESEKVMNHPVRRRILMTLMLAGNAGIVTVVGTLVVAFSQGGGADAWLFRTGVLAGAFVALWFLTWNPWIDRRMSKTIAWALRHLTDVDARDYAALLKLSDNYAVMELSVHAKDWIAEKTLAEAELRREGVVVLGIQRTGGVYIGVPKGDTPVHAGDTVIIYGRSDLLTELDRRRRGRSGDRAHKHAVVEQEHVLAEQVARDEVVASSDAEAAG